MCRFITAFAVPTALCLLAFSGNNQSRLFDVSYAPSGIQWWVFVPATASVLTVSGPDGYYWRQEYAPGSRPQFGVVDEQGVPLPEGLYRWELVGQLPPGAAGEIPHEPNPVLSGSFVISGSTIIPKPDDVQPAMVEEGAPQRSLFLDREGRLGLGTTVPQSQLHLKGSDLAVTLEDTTTGGRAFTLRGLEKGDGSLGLFDQAGEARWLVDGEGRVGISTAKPTSTLTVDGYIETTKGFLVNGRPIGAGFGLIGGSQPLYTETDNNNFFGIGAGASNTTGSLNSFFGVVSGTVNTTGSLNSFFGVAAGNHNTTGFSNSFFGEAAGLFNTTGSDNSFFGVSTGLSNTVENFNTFIGLGTDLNPGPSPSTSPVTNATAIGYRAYVAQSNSLVLGSIAGVNGAESYVNVGIGTTTPARQLHLAGPNAVFRMDRTTDTASFIMVRTDPTGVNAWKTFVVGTNATGVNQGEFIINDIGAAVGGGGNRRMTISNEGSVTFTGQVYAAGFTPTSSRAFKTNIRTFENALDTVKRLRGVRFDWKESGTPAVGLIAEEVDEVVPEVVAHENGTAKGVNYANLVAVLVEAVKEQQKTINKQQAEIDSLTSLKAKVEKLEALLQAR